jgi:hypothetical protein
MDQAGRYLEQRRLPPAAREWARSVRLSEAPETKHGFSSYKLKRHRELYWKIAAQLVRDGFFELATNGGPMGLWFERFQDGSALFGYLTFGASGTSTIGGGERELMYIARHIEFALLNSRVHPLVQQPRLAEEPD